MPDYRAGDRVYMLFEHEVTGQEKRKYGTVSSDEIEGWDYISVRFDDFPQLDQAVLSYYLYRDEAVR